MAVTDMKPVVLVSSACKQLSVYSFIEQMISVSDEGTDATLLEKPLLGDMSAFEHIKAFEWILDTKYYKAPINVCACKARVVPPSRDFADTVEAVIILFDAADSASFEEVTRWSELIDDLYSPALKLLVCKNVPTDTHTFSAFEDSFDAGSGYTKNNGVTGGYNDLPNWCLKNEFELVELEPATQDEDLDDLAYHSGAAKGSNYGFARIRSALKAHTWSNLRLKPSTVSGPAALMLNREFGSDIHISDAESGPAQSLEETFSQIHITNTEATPDEANLSHTVPSAVDSTVPNNSSSRLSSVLPVERTDDDDDAENDDGSFESLFTHLREAKNRAEGMTDEERRQYAEQVTCEFWRAIGGEEDEIAGGDSDGEN